MPFKKNKLYEKKMVVGMRKTKDRIAEKFLRGKKRSNENASEFYGGSDEEANQWEDVEQKKKDDMAKPGARKHTHDKDVPGLHPNLAQDAHKKPKETRIIPKKQLRSIQGRLNELRAKKSAPIVTNSEALPLDHGRSAGNVSIRNVLATFRMKNKQPLSLYYRIKPIALPRVIKLIARFGLLWEMVMYLMIVMTFCAISFSAFFAFFEQASLKTLPFFNAKVEEYYKYLWTYREGVFDVRFMQQFTKTFHEELLFNTCKEMFDKSQLFYKMDATFLRSISKVVEVALYNPNMILCRKGNYANKMYYILQGECQAMSKLNRANASAVIRAGSIVGEANLFFSFPYTTTVETRTCCQFIILHKKHLLPLLDQYKTELETLRSRSLNKIKEVYDTHQSYGENPILWVKAKTDMENPSYPNADKLRRNMRWGSGLNKEVLEDVVDDSHETVIFETPCSDQSVLKNHLTPYMTCVVPEIMNSEMKWIKLWNFFIMSIAVWYAFFGPFCLVFGESTKLEHYVCTAQNFASGVISLIFLVDVFVEIMGACPVKGYYYQFWNGLKVVTHQPPFYLDCLAALPLYFVNYEIQSVLQIAATLLKVTKLWKTSWLASYEVQWRSSNDPFDKMPNFMKLNTLGYGSPYLYSFFYSAATLTSAGFGDFNPQNRTEMLWAIGFQLFGFYLIGYYTAVLTSALSCVMRPKVALQQQLVSLCQFMNHYHLREHLKDRVIEYFVLQHQLRGGVSLDNYGAIMYDAPEYMRNDVLYLEVCDLLEGVPIFSKVEADAIISLSQAMTRFIIPPDTTFLQKGEVRRILYVIKSGSMGVYDDEKCHEPVSILEPSCHFGVRDLLFGEPSHYIIRSLSYVCMYSIKHTQFKNLFNDHDDEFGDLIGQEKQRTKHVIREMTVMYSKMAKNVPNPDKPTRIPSWVVIPPRVDATATKVLGQVDPKHIAMVHLLNDEYEDLFRKFKYSGFLRKFLLRKTIHPAGNFSKSWNCVMSLVCCFTVTTLMLETFCYMRMPWFRVFQSHLDWVNYVDIYLKLHWSYYNPYNGVMITHPLKTATNYILHGSLVMDVAICAPLELIIWALGLTDTWGYGRSATWYSRLRWIRFFQFKRIPIVFHIVHNTFKHRGIILLTLYVTLTVFVCTIVSAIALYIACPWEGNVWKEGDQYRLPICMKNSWPANKYKDLDTNPAVISTVLRRWVLGVYYVSQVILVIGFGDMITLEKSDIVLLVFMCVFGFIFMRCVIADMTAAEVDSDEARANFVENMIVLDLVMKREKVPSRVSSSVMSHLRYTWSRSRGLQPRELFGDLHPVLESELYRNLVGEQLKKVPIFHSFSPTVLRSLCSYMKKLYILRGERIMRFGNLEYEMCIILAGKVLIADQHLNYVCSLGPGESFGECSMIYGSARRHNAIAACNTELYILSSYNFQNFLERYPNFKSNFKKNMASGKRDYFEKILDRKMEKAKGLSKEKKKEMLDTFAQRSRAVKDLVGQKEDLEEEGLDYKSNRNRFFGYGQLDDNLPLIYIAEPQMRM
ncbi:unnamed protein product [Orchesella dallaii]|uniref:Cyclic nucleotide-binding domain-containing protein n=1 Tax=Orchesella dallaii TaxID=48710 RepID=A0ABP1SA48_9HEXA